MSLKDVITFIKSLKENQFRFKIHSDIRISERELNKETIIHYLVNEEEVGIHYQNNNVYKLWYEYNNIEDLTIIVKLNKDSIYVITNIKENKFKRLKNKKNGSKI